MMRMKLVATLLLLLVLNIQVARAQSQIEELDLNGAVKLVELLQKAKAAEQQFKKAQETLNLAQNSPQEVINKIKNNADVRNAVKTLMSEFITPLLTEAKNSDTVRKFLAFQQEVEQLQSQLEEISQRLETTQDVAEEQVRLLSVFADHYALISNPQGAVQIAQAVIYPALSKPREFEVGDGKLKVQLIGEVKQLFSRDADLSVLLEYEGGFVAQVNGVRFLKNGKIDFSKATAVPDLKKTAANAASQILGEALKEIDIPLPVQIEEVKFSIDQSHSPPMPTLSADVSVQIPGMEFISEMLSVSSKNNTKVRGTILITPGKSVSEIKITPPNQFEAELGSNPAEFPLGTTGMTCKLTRFGVFGLKTPDKGIKVTGTIQAPSTDFAVALEIETKLILSGKPHVQLKGAMLVTQQAIGDFVCEVSENGIQGTITFPSRKNPMIYNKLSQIYSGNFNFELTHKAFSADGIGQLVKVLEANFELFLSLTGTEDSFFKASQRLSLDGFSGEATVFAKLEKGFAKLEVEITAWVSVDLGIYKPTARIDIAAVADPASKMLVEPLTAFEYRVSASALGIKVSFEVPSLSDISISNIEGRLAELLTDMLNRIASSAARWENEKRGLLSKWERHWAETLANEAEKWKFSSGNKELDNLMGQISEGGKNAGAFLSKFAKGAGGQAARTREQIYEGVKQLDPSNWFSSLERQSPFVYVAYYQDEQIEYPEQFLAVVKDWQDRRQFSDLQEMAEPIRSRISDEGKLEAAATGLGVVFGPGYGTKLAKAIVGESVTPPTPAEIQDAEAVLRQFAFAIPELDQGLGDLPPELADFEAFANALNSFETLKFRQDNSVQRTFYLSFGDAYVVADDPAQIEVLFIARVVGSELNENTPGAGTVKKAGTNLVALRAIFNAIQSAGGGYTAEIEVPDLTVLNEQQHKWIKEQAAVNSPEATFDFTLSPQEMQDKAKVEALLKSVFGVNAAPGGFDVNAITRYAVQSVIERKLPGVAVLGKRAFTEKKILLRNITNEAVRVQLKVRQRRNLGGQFHWSWSPGASGDGEYFVFHVPSGETLKCKYDTANHFDDFGNNAVDLQGSRLMGQIESPSGERWEFDDESLFLVDNNPRLGNDRIYESTTIENYVFTIQSRLAPDVKIADLDPLQSVIEHQGKATSQFYLPLGQADASAVMNSLHVEPVLPPQSNVDPLYADWNWNATVVNSSANNNLPVAQGPAIRIDLAPQTPPQSVRPGDELPASEVRVRYSQNNNPWQANYQLYLRDKPNFSGRQFESALRGFYVFENATGFNWKSTLVKLSTELPGVSGEVRSLPGVNLGKNQTRLTLQASRPLKVKSEPYLVFDPNLDSTHPLRYLRMENQGKDSVTAGTLVVIDNGRPRPKLNIQAIPEQQSIIVAYPGIPEDRMCIKRDNEVELQTSRITCFKHQCLYYVPSRRQLQFQANYSQEYARIEVPILLRFGKEAGWLAGEVETLIGNAPAKALLKAWQKADNNWEPKSVDVCYASIKDLKQINVDPQDPSYRLVQKIIEYREQNDWAGLNDLICKPDLIIKSIKVHCQPVTNGMKLCVKVTVKNQGGHVAVFNSGETVLKGNGFEPVVISRGETHKLLPCKTWTWELESVRNLQPGLQTLEFTIDPDGVIEESDEQNNSNSSPLEIPVRP